MTPEPTRNDQLLHCVADCLSVLLEPGDFDATLGRILAIVGPVVDADRAYLFENQTKGGDVFASQRCEWVRHGVSSQQGKPTTTRLSYENDLAEIYGSLSAGHTFSALPGDMTGPLGEILIAQDIQSLVLVPLMLEGGFHGFLGLDDCRRPRVWSPEHVEFLRAVAAGVASALVRHRIDESVRSRAEELSRSRRVALSLMEDAQKAVKEAEAANRAKSSFLAMMSHEIRTPLNGVIGFAELLQAEQLTEKQQEIAATIRTCGSALLGLISDILDLSKIEVGKLEFEMTPFCPVTCAREVLAAFEPTAGQKDVVITFYVDESVPETVVTDAKRFRQILFNLVGNAVKFTPKGDVELRMKTDRDDAGDIRLHCIVSDSGIGMTQEELASIFRPFEQANAAIHRRFGGSGLGLTICRNLVEAMGGTISVKSEPGAGATFAFDLPVRIGAASVETAASSGLPDGIDPAIRVLVVDDVPTNVRLTTSMLRRMGCDPQSAGDGREAIALAKAEGFDLIFMDVLMPICDGIEAAREIRQIEEAEGRKPAWIVALTADAFTDNRERCLDAGMDDFLSKPLRFDALRSAVQRCSALRTNAGNPHVANQSPEG